MFNVRMEENVRMANAFAILGLKELIVKKVSYNLYIRDIYAIYEVIESFVILMEILVSSLNLQEQIFFELRKMAFAQTTNVRH